MSESRELLLPLGGLELPGNLTVPTGAGGLVVFVHGSGSSRFSPRNRAVAEDLNAAGLGTLLFDLLTPAEEGYAVFDIDLLAARCGEVVRWLGADPTTSLLAVGLFGASTGAAAALVAAADPRLAVRAIVSRGGRPDLAGRHLRQVRAPTRLIVGGADDLVLSLNREAAAQLMCEHDLCVVPGATHLFEEPGTLAEVSRLAAAWFTTHLLAAAG